jgi:hypothetical protein
MGEDHRGLGPEPTDDSMADTSNIEQLRECVAAGAYVVDTDLVAGTIARKLVEATRLQRVISQYRDVQSREEDGHSRPGRAAPLRSR